MIRVKNAAATIGCWGEEMKGEKLQIGTRKLDLVYCCSHITLVMKSSTKDTQRIF